MELYGLLARRSIVRGGGGGGDDGSDDDYEYPFDSSGPWEGEGEEEQQQQQEIVEEEVEEAEEFMWESVSLTLNDLQSIFSAQERDGSWSLESLSLVGLSPSDVEEFLLSIGAKSLGNSVCKVLFKFLATLLVLKGLSKQSLPHSFPVLFGPKVALASGGVVSPTRFKQNLLKAIEFAVKADRQFPSLYSRLEMGSSWEEVLSHPNKLLKK